jgi:hypothetical protein
MNPADRERHSRHCQPRTDGNAGQLGETRIGRRTLMRLAGMTTGVLAVPALGKGIPHAAAATPGPTPDLLRGGTYPIGFWWPPPPQETTAARYAEIADAGFTFVNGGNGVQNLERNTAMLQVAALNGLPAVVVDDRISNIQNHPRDAWAAVVKATLQDYQQYPAFAGFNIRDEPNASLFSQIGTVNDLLRRFDPKKLGYVNLFPTYANSDQLGTPTYQDYLDRYVAESDPGFVSFDHYGLVGPSPGLRPDYFYNWVLVRNKALQADLPFWGFILACAHFNYRLPTEAELLWQINVGLAYGCKGIQYFTYWTPEPPEIFREALVSRDGELLPLYYAAQRVNNDHLRPMGKQLLHLTSESVTHFGEAEPPMGVEIFTGDDWVTSAEGSAAILSRFGDEQGSDKRWLLVTNRSFDSAATTALTLPPTLGALFEFDTSRDEYTLARTDDTPDGQVLQVNLSPGGARLYRLHRDAD